MEERHEYNVCVKRSITINAAPEELYRTWLDPETMALFLGSSGSVDKIDSRRARWTSLSPAGGCSSWEAEIIGRQENRLVAWRTTGEGGCDHEAVIRFAPAPKGLGTEVSLEYRSQIAGGRAGGALAGMLGWSPEQYVSRILRNFKQLVETGEVVSNEGPRGRPSMAGGVVQKSAMAGLGLVLAASLVFLIRRRGERREGFRPAFEPGRFAGPGLGQMVDPLAGRVLAARSGRRREDVFPAHAPGRRGPGLGQLVDPLADRTLAARREGRATDYQGGPAWTGQPSPDRPMTREGGRSGGMGPLGGGI